MFWAQYLSTVQNNTLKSNCLMNSHFVIKNFILSSMKMLKELFIDWSVSIYQCKTKFYKKACYDNSAVWPVQNTGTQPYTDSCFVPASTQWCSQGRSVHIRTYARAYRVDPSLFACDMSSLFLYNFLLHFCRIIYWKCPAEKPGDGISEILNFKIFWGSMPPDPPWI